MVTAANGTNGHLDLDGLRYCVEQRMPRGGMVITVEKNGELGERLSGDPANLLWRADAVAALTRVFGEGPYWDHLLALSLKEGQKMVSAAYTVRVPAETILRFRTAREIAEETPVDVDWIASPWVARGAVTEVDGKIKAAGKSTWVTHLCRAVLDGAPFMGEPTSKGKVVYLTEQPPASFRQALRRADLLERDDFLVLYYHDTRSSGLAWHEIAAVAVQKCVEVGGTLLVADTLGQFAGLRGDAENSAGDALAAVLPLQEGAAAAGLGIIIVRHERKGGGEVGDSGRGSSAFGGAADIVLSLRRGEGAARESMRVIHALSRFDETPATLVIDLGPDGYTAIGSEAALATAMAADALLDVAPTTEETAKPLKDLLEATEGVKRTAAQEALRELVASGRMNHTGTGKRNDAKRYWRPLEEGLPVRETGQEMVFAGTATIRAAETISGLQTGGGHLVRAALEAGAQRVTTDV